MAQDIYKEIDRRIRIQIMRWKEEKKSLQGAQARIDALNILIDEGKAEHAAFVALNGARLDDTSPIDPPPPEAP